MLAPVGLRFGWLRTASAGSRPMRWFRTPFMGRRREPVAGRRDPKRSPTGASIGIPQSGRRRLKNRASQNRSGRASSLRMSRFFSRRGRPAPFRCSPRRGCASDGSGPPRLALAQCGGFVPRSWADAVSRWPGGGIRSAAPLGRASESRSPDAGGSRTVPHKTEAAGLRACGCQGSLAAEAALSHSDARPNGAALRMAPGRLGWHSPNAVVSDPVHG